jgi:hypothetical protein
VILNEFVQISADGKYQEVTSTLYDKFCDHQKIIKVVVIG